jgi:hypothetical protein
MSHLASTAYLHRYSAWMLQLHATIACKGRAHSFIPALYLYQVILKKTFLVHMNEAPPYPKAV